MAVARLSLYIPHSHSLKEKRAVVRKITDRIQARFKLHIAEVGGQDTWQRAVLGFAVVASDAQRAGQLADELVRAVQSLAEGECQVIAVDRDTIRFGEEEALAAAARGDEPLPRGSSPGEEEWDGDL